MEVLKQSAAGCQARASNANDALDDEAVGPFAVIRFQQGQRLVDQVAGFLWLPLQAGHEGQPVQRPGLVAPVAASGKLGCAHFKLLARIVVAALQLQHNAQMPAQRRLCPQIVQPAALLNALGQVGYPVIAVAGLFHLGGQGQQQARVFRPDLLQVQGVAQRVQRLAPFASRGNSLSRAHPLRGAGNAADDVIAEEISVVALRGCRFSAHVQRAISCKKVRVRLWMA